jgi:hypothetical protein
MTKNGVTTTDLQPEAEWTFVHSSGKRTLYIYDRQALGAGGGLDVVHALRNPLTGKDAFVTESWLRGHHRNGKAHWLVGNHVEAPVAA